MTTAARPTWEPARGGGMKGETDLGKLSKQISTRDLPTQMTLKYRQDGQGNRQTINVLEIQFIFKEMKQNTKTWKFMITKKILNHVKEKPVKNEIKKNIIKHLEGKWSMDRHACLPIGPNWSEKFVWYCSGPRLPNFSRTEPLGPGSVGFGSVDSWPLSVIQFCGVDYIRGDNSRWRIE